MKKFLIFCVLHPSAAIKSEFLKKISREGRSNPLAPLNLCMIGKLITIIY